MLEVLRIKSTIQPFDPILRLLAWLICLHGFILGAYESTLVR